MVARGQRKFAVLTFANGCYNLLKKCTFFAGTVRPNCKNFPDDLKVNKQMNVNVFEIGNFRFTTCEDLTAVLWRDRCEC